MKKFLITLSMLFFLTFSIFSQEQESEFALTTGVEWSEMNEQEKVVFVKGFRAGVHLLMGIISTAMDNLATNLEDTASSLFRWGYSDEEIAKAVDDYYRVTMEVLAPVFYVISQMRIHDE